MNWYLLVGATLVAFSLIRHDIKCGDEFKAADIPYAVAGVIVWPAVFSYAYFAGKPSSCVYGEAGVMAQ